MRIVITLLIAIFAHSIGMSQEVRKELSRDSTDRSYEEWLRNEPLHTAPQIGGILAPVVSDFGITNPTRDAERKADRNMALGKRIQSSIMTDRLRTDMQLAAASHQLEEQRKAQIGGAMAVGLGIPSIVGLVLHLLLPQHKSQEERDREKLQRVLDNY